MCLITEHARLKKKLTEAEAEIDRLKLEYEPVLPSDYPRIDISWHDLVAELKELGVELMLKAQHMPDSKVTHTDEKSWAKITPYLVYPADLYVEGVADCDDYARWAAADSSKKFRLNGCLECWGDSKWGYHAYSLVRVALREYRVFEPNAGAPYAGELMKFGDNDYAPKYWRL